MGFVFFNECTKICYDMLTTLLFGVLCNCRVSRDGLSSYSQAPNPHVNLIAAWLSSFSVRSLFNTYSWRSIDHNILSSCDHLYEGIFSIQYTEAKVWIDSFQVLNERLGFTCTKRESPYRTHFWATGVRIPVGCL